MNCKSKLIVDEKQINVYWSSLTEEEKLQYETVDKDSIKPANDIESKDDLVKYFTQEQKNIPKFFCSNAYSNKSLVYNFPYATSYCTY